MMKFWVGKDRTRNAGMSLADRELNARAFRGELEIPVPGGALPVRWLGLIAAGDAGFAGRDVVECSER